TFCSNTPICWPVTRRTNCEPACRPDSVAAGPTKTASRRTPTGASSRQRHQRTAGAEDQNGKVLTLSTRLRPDEGSRPGLTSDAPVTTHMGTPRPGEWKEKPKGTKEFHLYGFGPSRSQRAAGKSSVRDRISSGALVAAGVLIAAGIAGGIRVVYDAQFRFALAYNWGHEDIAHIQAAIPEVVWVGMALLGLAQALRGRKSARAVSGILLFFSL